MNYPQWLWKNSRGSRLSIFASIVLGTVYTGLGLLMVWLSRRFIDTTIRTGTSADIWRMVAWLAVVAVAGVMLRQLSYRLMTMADIRLTNALRLRIFHSLFHRSLFGKDQLHSGDVSSRLGKDIEQVSKVMTDTLPQIAVTAIQITGAFLLLRWFDARLAWALIILTPIALASGKLISRRLRKMTLDIRRDESQVQMQVQEAMENNAVLRSLGSEEWMADRLDTLQRRLKENIKRRVRYTVIIRIIMGCCFSLGYLLAFVWGGIGLRDGTITFGTMTSFLQLVGMIQHPILQLLNKVPEVVHATASIDRLDELETGERLESSVGKSEDGSVCLKGVTFCYADSDRPVFDKFSHVFNPGSKTAIMGATGIGKTTLFRLLLGQIEPAEGSVEVGGRLSFVPQGNTLMSGTIRHNLQLAAPDATENELREALHTACADFVFEFPEGLDTELGEHGHGLSEGQAQRVAIARGLLHGGDILLLDEISSSLDEATERELYRRLFARYPGKTIIFITHRTAVNEWCDEVVRL